MVDLIMRKRAGRPGEIGLFVDAEVFEEDFSHIKMDAEVTVKATVQATQKYNRFSWVIAGKVADASEAFDTKEDARDHILIECRHFRRRFDKLRDKAEIIPKPTRDLDGTEWLRLIRRMVHIAVTQFGLPENEFSRELQQLSPSEPPRSEEPPPHDHIPEGLGTSPEHATQERSDRIHELDAPQEGASASMPSAEYKSEWMEEAAPLPPQGRQKAKSEAPPPDRQGIVQTVDMAGEPDWRIDTPGDNGSYQAYMRYHIENASDHASILVFFNSDEQWNLRQQCKVGLSDRKHLERQIADKFR